MVRKQSVLIVAACIAVCSVVSARQWYDVDDKPHEAVEPNDQQAAPPPPSESCRCGCNRQGCRCGRIPAFGGCGSMVRWNEDSLNQLLQFAEHPRDERPIQWLFFVNKPCQFCAAAEGEIRAKLKGWTIGRKDDDQIRLVDSYDHPELVEQYGIQQFPTFVLVSLGKPVKKHVGFPGAIQMANEYNEEANRQPPSAAIASLGGNEIDRQAITEIKEFLLGVGSITFEKKFTKKAGPVTITFPEGCRVRTTGSMNDALVTANPRIIGEYGVIQRELGSIRMTNDQVVVDIIGMLIPDIVIDQVDVPKP